MAAPVQDHPPPAARRKPRKARERRPLWSLPFRLVGAALLAAGLAVLPFYCLIRGGVFAYRQWDLGTWPALMLSAFGTALVLVLYACVLGWRARAPRYVRGLLRQLGVALAVAYVVYALVYVAAANFKSEEVRAEYATVHPLLRLAASTLILVDGEAVVTDAGRTQDDYRLMGLTPREASLHFPQETGFVHAIDLRTRGRSELWNRSVELAFWAMGFHALRHVGTADHLHVSLRLPE